MPPIRAQAGRGPFSPDMLHPRSRHGMTSLWLVAAPRRRPPRTVGDPGRGGRPEDTLEGSGPRRATRPVSMPASMRSNRAKTGADREGVSPSPTSRSSRAVPRIRPRAPKVEAEFDALTGPRRRRPRVRGASGLLVAGQVGHDRLGPVRQRLMTWRSQRVEGLSARRRGRARHRDVRATACYSRGHVPRDEAKRTGPSPISQAGEAGGKEKTASAESPREGGRRA